MIDCTCDADIRGSYFHRSTCRISVEEMTLEKKQTEKCFNHWLRMRNKAGKITTLLDAVNYIRRRDGKPPIEDDWL